MKTVILKDWEVSSLQKRLNAYLDKGWKFQGEMVVYQETRRHIIHGYEYKAPMFMQVLVKPSGLPKPNIPPTIPKSI